jgi:hypothetical protein
MLKGGKMASKVPDILSLIELWRWELDKLHKLAVEYRNTVRESREWSVRQTSRRPPLVLERVQICRDRAEQTRVFAERAEDPQVRRILLEIADAYDRLPDGSSWDDA